MTTDILSHSSAGKIYTLTDFNRMLFEPMTFPLSEEVLNTLAFLEKNIEIPDFLNIPTTVSYGSRDRDRDRDRDREYRSEKPNGKSYSAPAERKSDGYRASFHHAGDNGSGARGNRNGNGYRKNAPPPEDWEAIRQFKTTKIETKTGVEKNINDIRILLNKMSAATYEKQCAAIIAEINGVVERDGEIPENMEKIANAILAIASNNKFYSEIYADLYVELVSRFSIFGDLLAKFVADVPASIDTIQYVDADVDYDAFCENTKLNDKRKSTTTFVVNLMKKGLVSRQTVVDILLHYIATVNRFMEEEGKSPHIEEITEYIFIIVSKIGAELKECPEWSSNVSPIIQQLSKTSPAKHKSMSNRIIFKYMDMVAFV